MLIAVNSSLSISSTLGPLKIRSLIAFLRGQFALYFGILVQYYWIEEKKSEKLGSVDVKSWFREIEEIFYFEM
jgi:hypothetical protein